MEEAFFKTAWPIFWDSIGVGKPMILAATCENFRSLVVTHGKSRIVTITAIYYERLNDATVET